jgi:hypothetical protein
MRRWVAGLVLVVLFGFAAALAVQETSGGPSDDCKQRRNDPDCQVTTKPPDGGADYYAQFASLPSDPSFFPIGVWGSYDLTGANIRHDRSLGINLYVWPADSSVPLSRFEAHGMHALLDESWYGAPDLSSSRANAGYMLDDEVDMRFGPGRGYDVMRHANRAAPDDGRARYANYGKGVMFWETDAEAEVFVNDFQQLVSSDIYWFTDPGVCEFSEGGRFLLGRDEPLPAAQCRRASNYGATVNRMQSLDRMDGRVKPIWNFVELGWPFTESAEQGGRAIRPKEVRAAVWHSIISGARGIVYFNHSFGGPCQTHHVLRESCGGSPAVREKVAKTNSLIERLAPVLNSPTVTSGFKHSRTVRATAKLTGGTFHVIAGSADNKASQANFKLPVDDAVVTVVGESRRLSASDGAFTDSFANGNSVHIYRIDRQAEAN